MNVVATMVGRYPPPNPTGCWGHSPDACGCDVPYDGSGVCANAVSTALADLQNALRHYHRCWRQLRPERHGGSRICAWP
jgi:hypothetical protein